MALEFNEGHQNRQLSLEDKDVINSLSEKKPESSFCQVWKQPTPLSTSQSYEKQTVQSC